MNGWRATRSQNAMRFSVVVISCMPRLDSAGCGLCQDLLWPPAIWHGLPESDPSTSTHPWQVDEFPRAGQRADRDFDERWSIAARQPPLEGRAKFLRVACAFRRRTKTLGISHKIGVGEVAGNDPVAEALFLAAPHIAVGIV